MAQADRPKAVRILLAVGLSGLAAELLFIGFNLWTQARGSDTRDLMLAEAALTAIVYGMLFALAFYFRIAPASHFVPRRSVPLWARKIGKLWFLFPLALLTFQVVFQTVVVAIGLFTPREAMVSLLHWYPIVGLWAAIMLAARIVEKKDSSPSSPESSMQL